MRSLRRNTKLVWFSGYSAKQPILDEVGNFTGEYDLVYEKPKSIRVSISSEKGEVQTQMFGNDLAYDKVMILDTAVSPIDENSILWVDKMPNLTAEGNTDTPHDYIVKKVAMSLNSTSIAIEKVNING